MISLEVGFYALLALSHGRAFGGIYARDRLVRQRFVAGTGFVGNRCSDGWFWCSRSGWQWAGSGARACVASGFP